MRKFLVAWLAAVLLLTALVIPAAAAPKLKDCADILTTRADGTEDSQAAFQDADDQVVGQFFLGANSCKNVTYTLVVLDDANDTSPIATASVVGTGTADSVEITVNGVSATDMDVCAYVTTSKGKNVTDRGPTAGCVLLFDDGSSGGGGKGF